MENIHEVFCNNFNNLVSKKLVTKNGVINKLYTRNQFSVYKKNLILNHLCTYG